MALNIDRRQFLRMGAFGAVVLALLTIAKRVPFLIRENKHGLLFFNDQEYLLVDELSELIIPTDDRSPGARAALVPKYIDLMVSESPYKKRNLWKDGLKELDDRCSHRFQKPFLKMSEFEKNLLLLEISKNENKPTTTLEKFFTDIKKLTVRGYYTSEIGIHQELKYKGNTSLAEYVGCSHPEHQG